MQPKTIEAYSHAVRRAGKYFNYQIDALTEDQFTEYFSDLLSTHSWSTLEQMQRIIASTKMLSYRVFFTPFTAWACAWERGCACNRATLTTTTRTCIW